MINLDFNFSLRQYKYNAVTKILEESKISGQMAIRQSKSEENLRFDDKRRLKVEKYLDGQIYRTIITKRRKVPQ